MSTNDGRIFSGDAEGLSMLLTKASSSISLSALLNFVDGTLEETLAGRVPADPEQDSDRGVLPAKIRVGGEVPGRISVDAMYVSTASSVSLMRILAASGVDDDGYFTKIDQVVIKEPDKLGSATGVSRTYVNLVPAERPVIKRGGKSGRDTIRMSLMYTKEPTYGTY